jgi:hypothetical protein
MAALSIPIPIPTPTPKKAQWVNLGFPDNHNAFFWRECERIYKIHGLRPIGILE